MFTSSMVWGSIPNRARHLFSKQTRNTWEVLKCGAGEEWTRSVGQIM
jgi:hypothetical protein